MLALAIPALAQQTSDQNDEEIVRLSPFAVQENADIGRYQAAESSSGTRVRMNLMDSTQSISVVTNELMQDIGTARLTDATKYVAGLSNIGSLPFQMDLMNVRGFSDFNLTLDGFTHFSLVNQDPIIVERIEFVKSPNAILAPDGNTREACVSNSSMGGSMQQRPTSISYRKTYGKRILKTTKSPSLSL